MVTRPKDAFTVQGHGMLIDPREHETLVSVTGDTLMPTAGVSAASSSSLTVLAKRRNYMRLRQIAANAYRIVLPISELFPWIRRSFEVHNGMCYIGTG